MTQASETKCLRKLLSISYLEHKTNDWCGARSTSSWVHRNLLRQLSRDWNLHGSGMAHATTASLKPSFTAPWRLATPWSAEEMLDGRISKSGHPCRCQKCSQWPPAGVTGRESLLNQLWFSPTTQSVKGLNWTELSRWFYMEFTIPFFFSVPSDWTHVKRSRAGRDQNSEEGAGCGKWVWTFDSSLHGWLTGLRSAKKIHPPIKQQQHTYKKTKNNNNNNKKQTRTTTTKTETKQKQTKRLFVQQ